MAGMFDDLIPSQAIAQSSPASNAAMFEDLIPKSNPSENWSRIGAENLHDAGITPPRHGDGALKNFAAGTMDALTSIPGLIADMGAAQANAESGYTMMPDHAEPVHVGGTVQHYLNEQLGRVDLNPESVTANTTTEHLARAAGYGAAMTAAPELAVSKGASIIQRGLRTAKAGHVGASSGVGAEAAQEAAPGPYKGVAGLVGGLAGGVTGALTTAVPRGVKAATGAVARSVGPITDSGAQRMAAERLATSATDPAAVRASLNDVQEYVPGSKPTTFQQTGDMGLGALEREVQTRNPAEFQQRRADQNGARLSQLDTLQPNGSPADLPDYIRGRMRWMDEQTEQDVANATRFAQQRTEALGGTDNPEHYGANLRVAAQQAQDEARKRERALWRAVDPDGDLTINAAPIKGAAEDLLGSLSGSTKPMTGDEQAIMSIAKGYNHTVPFRDVGDLRSWVSDAMRTELRTNGQTQTYGRLTRLRGAIEGAINGAVEQRAQQAPQALQDEVAAFARSLGQDARRWEAARGSHAQGIGILESFGAGGVSPRPGTPRAVNSRLSNPASDQGISGTPTFDASAAERLRVATQATRERADTFGRGPVGQVLAKAGRQDQYKLSDASVPAKVFQPGARGGESVQAYRNAVGDPQAMLTLQDYAASSVRQYAGKLDGTLDAAKVEAWTQRHADALRAFPELGQRFRDAATASDVIADAMTARRAGLDAYQTGVFSKLIGISNPEDVTRAIGGILNSQTRVAQVRQLAFTARRNPNAFAGLRKGIADYIQNRFVSNTEAATSGQGTIKADAFQAFVKDHEAALRYVFSPDELKSMKAIAADLNRSNRSLSAIKIPNQSNTAQDLAALQNGRPSILKRLLLQGAGAAGGAAAGMATATGATLPAMAGWLGVKTLAAFRDAGLKRVDDVLREAMLNPELAKALLDKVPARPDIGTADRLRAVLRKAALTSGTVGANAAKSQPSREQTQSPVVQTREVINALALPSQRNALAAVGSMPAQNALLGSRKSANPANNSLSRASR